MKKQSLKGIQKQCINCDRVLSGRCYIYNQHSPDKLRDCCRTCDSYRPKGYPPLSAVLAFESEMHDIIEEAKQIIEDPERQRIAFESFVYEEMQRRELLNTWKPPVWLHKTSIRKMK